MIRFAEVEAAALAFLEAHQEVKNFKIPASHLPFHQLDRLRLSELRQKRDETYLKLKASCKG